MEKNKTIGIIIVTAIVALLLGICLGKCSGGPGDSRHMIFRGPEGDNMMFNKKIDGEMMMVTKGQGDVMGMSMNLEDKTGDEFDKAFIDVMIMHHEGAVEMANVALTNAKHQEIKDLANAIILSQTKEITDMKAWKKSWFNQ